MSKLSPLNSGIWRSQELIKPVLGSSINIQPKVVGQTGHEERNPKAELKRVGKKNIGASQQPRNENPRGQGNNL